MREEFTYATRDRSSLRRTLIQLLEAVTGKQRLVELYQDYQQRENVSETPWDFFLRRMSIKVDVDDEKVENIPAQGPLVVVANHPYGITDGAAALHVISRRRPDVKFFANTLAQSVPELRDAMFPVSFHEDHDSRMINFLSYKQPVFVIADSGKKKKSGKDKKEPEAATT